MKKMALLLLLSCCIGMVKAQESISLSSIPKDTSPSTWHVLKQGNGVTVSYQYVDCGPLEFVLFKLTNSTTQNAIVSFDLKIFSNNAEVESNPDDMKISVTVNANSSVTKTCENGPIKLGLFVRETAGTSVFDMLKIFNLNVTPQ